jgi:hypothetical protein
MLPSPRRSISLLLALFSCSQGTGDGLPEHSIEDTAAVVTQASELLSGPNDIAVDDDGAIYVLDYLLAHVVVVSPSGKLLRTIGRHGSGPGEFALPRSFVLSGDTLRVVDVGAGRLQIVDRDGHFVRATPLPPAASMGDVAVDDAGAVLVSTLGVNGALVTYYDETGGERRNIGIPPAPTSTIANFTAMKKEILSGSVPALFRNAVLPVLAPDGGLWLVLKGEGTVQRYDSLGSLLLGAPLAVPEMQRIWQHLVDFTRTIMNDQRRMAGLAYVTDAVAQGDTLWVLLNMPEDEASVVLTIRADGTVAERLVFKKVRGAQGFVLDRPRNRVLFLIPSEASVIAAPWPDGTS